MLKQFEALQLMQFGLYGTTFAAQRLFSAFKFSRFGRMTSRGVVSSRAGNGDSVNSRDSLTDDEQGKQHSRKCYEKDFPALSSSISPNPKSKRRSKLDVVTPIEQEVQVIQNNDRSPVEALSSMSQPTVTDLPSSSGKKHTPPTNPKLRETYHEHDISNQYDTDLPLGFGKKLTPPSPKLRDTYCEHDISNQYDTNSPTRFGKKPIPPPRNSKLPETYRENDKSCQNDTYLPTSFGKKHKPPPRNPKLSGTYREHDIIDQNDTPYSFGKKRTPSPINRKHWENHKRVESKRSLKLSPSNIVDEPFDICLPEIRESDSDKVVYEKEQVLRPGMVFLKHYLPISEQVDIVKKCRELGCGPGGFYRPGYEDGAKLRLHMMCLGLDWDPQTKLYDKIRQHGNVAPPDIPDGFASLVNRVLNDSHSLIKRDMKIENVEDVLPSMSPDVCIVNFYNTTGRLGLHQDRDESKESLRKGLPVVSISVGDSAEFVYSDYRDADKAERVLLESGDVLVFGGESRHIFHGVKTIIPNTAPLTLLQKTRLRPGRLNLTFRKF